MGRLVARLALSLLILVAGCARRGSTVFTGTPIGPHGGPTVVLPGGAGVGEVVIEVVPGGSGSKQDDQVVAYFLTSDLKAVAASLPSDVSVKLEFPDRAAETIALSAESKADDATGSARFASAPGSFPVDFPVGELSGKVNGQSFKLKFAGTR